MAEKETVYVLGENGSVMPHDLPLPWGIQDRIDKGQLKLVDPPETAPAESGEVEVAEAAAPTDSEAPTEEPAAEAPAKKTVPAKAK